MFISLLINRVTSYFTCRKPTGSEYEYGDLTIIDLSAEALDWDPSDQDYAKREEATIEFRGAMVNEETTEKVPNILKNQVSLGKGAIDVSSDDEFGLALESNINVSNKFDSAVDRVTKTAHKIIQVGTSVSKKSLTMNH